MFKKPFEEIMYSEIFIDLEKNYDLKEFQEGKRRENEIYRLHIVNQKDLWEFGRDKKTGEYGGNKWGGKYLRAPEIYWKILEKGKNKLVKLGDIAGVRFGIKTGANEFFYVEDVTDKIDFLQIKSRIQNLGDFDSLEEIKKARLRIVRNTKTGDYWLIEEEFLNEILIPLGEICEIITGIITGNNKKYYKKRESLLNEKEYSLVFKTPTEHKKIILKTEDAKWFIKNKNLPFKLKSAPILWVDIRREKHIVYWNKDSLFFEHTFIGLKQKNHNIDVKNIILILNSTLSCFLFEVLGRVSISGPIRMLGDEIISFPVINLKIFSKLLNEIDTSFLDTFLNREIKSIFVELGFDPQKPIREQEPNPLPDRKALDDIVFDALGLTEEERKEVYWAVAELVQNRLKKAKSV